MAAKAVSSMHVSEFVNYLDVDSNSHVGVVTKVTPPLKPNEVETCDVFVFDYATVIPNLNDGSVQDTSKGQPQRFCFNKIG